MQEGRGQKVLWKTIGDCVGGISKARDGLISEGTNENDLHNYLNNSKGWHSHFATFRGSLVGRLEKARVR
jgi:hypothetical protein